MKRKHRELLLGDNGNKNSLVKKSLEELHNEGCEDELDTENYEDQFFKSYSKKWKRIKVEEAEELEMKDDKSIEEESLMIVQKDNSLNGAATSSKKRDNKEQEKLKWI